MYASITLKIATLSLTKTVTIALGNKLTTFKNIILTFDKEKIIWVGLLVAECFSPDDSLRKS